jgi:hypothetical protein
MTIAGSLSYVDPTDEEYRSIIRAELDGDAEAASYLEQNIDEWHRGLQELFLDIEAQFAKRKGDALAFQQVCLREDRPKREWFDYKAEYDQWRGRAAHFKKIVQARLAEVKEMRQGQHDDHQESLMSLVHEIIQRLERIEKLVQP